ncbi:MAG: hypothetical protein NC388_08905 [Clostridium sp.]|nr:hypothetical protein [Clostridium sp.]
MNRLVFSIALAASLFTGLTMTDEKKPVSITQNIASKRIESIRLSANNFLAQITAPGKMQHSKWIRPGEQTVIMDFYNGKRIPQTTVKLQTYVRNLKMLQIAEAQ